MRWLLKEQIHRGKVKNTLGREVAKGSETGDTMPCLRKRKAARGPGAQTAEVTQIEPRGR